MKQGGFKINRLGRWVGLGALAVLAGLGLTYGVVSLKLQQILYPIPSANYTMQVDEGQPIKHVILQTSDGLTLAGWYLASQNGAAIIVQHGYLANSAQMLPIGLMLARHGFGVLLFDFRGQGLSDKAPVTFGLNETKDTDAAVQFLQAQPDVDPHKIGLLGDSMGGAAGIMAAAHNQGIYALAVEGVFAELKDEVGIGIHLQTGLPAQPLDSIFIFFAQQQTGFRLQDVAPVLSIGQISPRPILIMQGGSDARIPLDSGERLLNAAGQPKSYWYEPSAPHVGFYVTVPGKYEQKIVGFLDESLLQTIQSP